ncbi:hypothetical protein FGO68_gene8562 [Halteria grandinella]|uniref:Adenosine deaminase domain-containing protein n=1 Tax=Halteria grandinella TaxID=5974 RepID=A0A8J8NKW7_HALGN|nr:hypothetical protein FGO68_gene8562 [Halteria grandinella]
MQSSIEHHFIHLAPKAELHVHLEGTLTLHLLQVLAKKHSTVVPKAYEELMGSEEKFELDKFFAAYYEAQSLLRDELDFAEALYSYLKIASSQGVRYCEVSIDIQNHTSRGVSLDTIMQGMKLGQQMAQKDGIEIEAMVIVCLVGEKTEEEALKTIEEAAKFRDLIVAIGLATSEVGLPIKKFERAFLMSKELGFKTCAHFWDNGASANIKDGLHCCKLERIDHGMSIFDDSKLLGECIGNQIPFTFCPQSLITFDQVKLDLSKGFPFRYLLEIGLLISVNSDDAAYNRAYIGDNFALVEKIYMLEKSHIKKLCENSFKSAFISEKAKKKYLGLVNDYFAQ